MMEKYTYTHSVCVSVRRFLYFHTIYIVLEIKFFFRLLPYFFRWVLVHSILQIVLFWHLNSLLNTFVES